jgi:asparagine synthase (glutamine-hydrolysing)
LDRELVEFVLALPASIRVDTRVYKGLLREVVEPWLPTDLLAAPKRGFVLPMRKWTRDELRPTLSELLGASFLRDQGLFDPLGVSTILGQHLDGGRDATDLIWTLMMFQFWWKSFVTARASGLRVGDRCA